MRQVLSAQLGEVVFPSRRSCLWVVMTVLALALLVYFMLDPLIRQMLYQAPPIPVPPAPPPLEEVILELPGGERVIGWSCAQRDASSPAAVFFHGNGDNLETVRLSGFFDQLAALGVHVLVLDYPGYGRSTGVPSEASLRATGEAGLAWIAQRYPESKKLVLGWSLGAAVAIRAVADDALAADGSDRARRRRADGLVLISPWSDLPSLAAIHYPGWLTGLGLKDTYDSVAAAGEVRVPVLMIHGETDQIIPLAQGQRLRDALDARPSHDRQRYRFVELPGVGHNDLMARPVVWQELGVFIQSFSQTPG